MKKCLVGALFSPSRSSYGCKKLRPSDFIYKSESEALFHKISDWGHFFISAPSGGSYEKVPPVGALMNKVPPVGALMKKCPQSELL